MLSSLLLVIYKPLAATKLDIADLYPCMVVTDTCFISKRCYRKSAMSGIVGLRGSIFLCLHQSLKTFKDSTLIHKVLRWNLYVVLRCDTASEKPLF